MTHHLHSAHTTKASCPPSSHPHHHRFQDSRRFNTKGSETQKPSEYTVNESSQLVTASSSSLSDSQQKDSHAPTTPQSERTRHYGEEISAVQPSATLNIPLPHCSSEVTASSIYGYLQLSSISLMNSLSLIFKCIIFIWIVKDLTLRS